MSNIIPLKRTVPYARKRNQLFQHLIAHNQFTYDELIGLSNDDMELIIRTEKILDEENFQGVSRSQH